jgi:AcrR family transcriptional regulator
VAVEQERLMATKESLREQRRQVHQELSRAQLLDAAEEIFGRKGFHATTLKEIAESADFSVGSVYTFFDNKEDLYASVWLRRGAEFLPAFEDLVAGVDDGLGGLMAIARYEIGFFRDRPAFSRLYIGSTTSVLPIAAAAAPPAVADNAARVLALQAEVIARGQREGIIRDGDADALARLFSAMVQAFQSMDAALVDSEHSLDDDEFLDLLRGAFAR